MINLAEERAKFEANRPVDCGCYCDAMPVLLAFAEQTLRACDDAPIAEADPDAWLRWSDFLDQIRRIARECGIEVPDG